MGIDGHVSLTSKTSLDVFNHFILMVQLIYKFLENNEVILKNIFIFFSVIDQKERTAILKIWARILTGKVLTNNRILERYKCAIRALLHRSK